MINFDTNYKGKHYNAQYEINGGIIKVLCNFYSKSTQIGGHASIPEILAKRLLIEIINENKL